MSLAARFSEAMERLTGPERSGPFGVAVSGGGDSVALMALAADWAQSRGGALRVVTVDHGLRPESAAEAAGVARQAADLGLAHDILAWSGWNGAGNLADAARRARLALIGAWAAQHGIGAVLLGHTRDDVAETLLMRLARGAGVDGLAAMAGRRRAEGTIWLRPLLGASRVELRAELETRGLSWIEDPSNQDPRYDRARTRAVLSALAPLGIEAEGLAATAGRLADARAALEAATAEAAQAVASVGSAGEVTLAAEGFAALPAEIRRRLIVGTLRWVASAPYAPRQEALAALMARLTAGQRGTLHGCVLTSDNGRITVSREAAAVAGLEAPTPGLWDGRWEIDGPPVPGATVRALGSAGLADCPDWRRVGAAREALIAGPAIWQGTRLLAAPLAACGEGWTAELRGGPQGYFEAFTPH